MLFLLQLKSSYSMHLKCRCIGIIIGRDMGNVIWSKQCWCCCCCCCCVGCCVRALLLCVCVRNFMCDLWWWYFFKCVFSALTLSLKFYLSPFVVLRGNNSIRKLQNKKASKVRFRVWERAREKEWTSRKTNNNTVTAPAKSHAVPCMFYAFRCNTKVTIKWWSCFVYLNAFVQLTQTTVITIVIIIIIMITSKNRKNRRKNHIQNRIEH